MATDIVNNGATLKITVNGASRLIVKSQILEITVIKTNIVKIDIGQGALQNVFISHPDVIAPVAATPEALRDALNGMLAAGATAGGSTEARQIDELTQLITMNNALSNLNGFIGQGGNGNTFGKALIEDLSNPNVVYRGYAVAGSLLTAAVWAIEKESYVNDIKVSQWADGNKNLDNVWNNRLTLSYS